MSYVNSLLDSSSTTSSASSSSSSSSSSSGLGMDAFLQLLVTQLQYQDPLNPTDDKEFVAQLATFSSLEQLTEINSGIENLTKAQSDQQMIGAVSFIGKTVQATGAGVSLEDGKSTPITFDLSKDASVCMVNILDSSVNIVRTVDLGSKSAGEVEFTWDGKDYNGNTLADGMYQVAVAAEDADGATMTVATQMSGTVQGIQQQNGQYYLDLGNGRYVGFTDITKVINDTTSANSGS